MDNLRKMVIEGMHYNIHFSKKLKKKYPDLYKSILYEYPGNQIKEKLWNFCHDNKTIPKCDCGNPVKFSNSFKTGYNRFCSCKCAQKSQDVRDARQKTNLCRLGVEHNFASKDVIEKKKKTWMEKYGVDNPAKDKRVSAKGVQTKIDRYGEEWLRTSFQRATLKKYGVDNWVQVPELYQKFSEKNSNKKYLLPSGREVHVQGYEAWALDILLNSFSETELCIHRGVPSIRYEIDGKLRVHYPDIFIPSRNLLIEVKSVYTFKSLYEKNMKKANAAVLAGYDYDLWIFDASKNLDVKEFRQKSNVVEEQ